MENLIKENTELLSLLRIHRINSFSVLPTITIFCNKYVLLIVLACSEFEELEAVPTMAVIDGPLEPSSSPTSNVADVPDDSSFVNYFSVRTHTYYIMSFFFISKSISIMVYDTKPFCYSQYYFVQDSSQFW